MDLTYKRHVAKPSPRVKPVGGAAGTRTGKIVKRADLDQAAEAKRPAKPDRKSATREIGGPAGPEPTRYGDWEIKGRCIDF